MTFRAAVVGCGQIGCGFDDDPKRKHVSTHARAYARTPGVQLAALCDIEEAKLARYGAKFGIASLYRDYRRMVECERPDIVSICTRSDSHINIAQHAAQAGVRAIFCEKPIAENLCEAHEMIRVCRDNGVLLFVNHQRRFDPFHQRAGQFVREGGIGKIQQVTCYYTAGIANTGTHLFDLLRLYLGDAGWVEARNSINPSGNAADPNLDGWLGFRSGVVAAIQAYDARAYTIFEFQLLGTDGRLRISSHGFAAEFERAAESERYSGYRELVLSEFPLLERPDSELMLRGVAHIRDCLRGEAAPVSTGEDGRAALEIVASFRQSALANGERINIPLVNEALAVSST